MAWRSPAVEAVLGVPLDGASLNEDVLHRLVAVAAREGEQLDFKAKPHLSDSAAAAASSASDGAPDKAWSAEQEFTKDVCGFANHLGGVLIIGIRDSDEVAAEVVDAPIADPGALEQRLRQALANFAAPVPQIEYIPILSTNGNYYVAIVVPTGPAAPHAVRGAKTNERRPLHYPVRDGAGTRWLLEHEVADRYRARAARRDERLALREALIQDGIEALARARTDDLWLYVGIAPESRTQARLDQRMVSAIGSWLTDYGFLSPLNRMLMFQSTILPAPGRVTATAHPAYRENEEEEDPRDHYVELYADGRAFAATAVGSRTDEDHEVRVIGELTVVDDTLMLVDLVVSWAAHQAGAWGEAEVVVGLIRSASSDFDAPVTIHEVVGGNLKRLARTRPVGRPIRSTTSVDLSSGSTQQGRLVAARDVLTVFLHHFGISEPRQLEPDGRIVPWAWRRDEREVERWARDRDLPVQDGDHSSWQMRTRA